MTGHRDDPARTTKVSRCDLVRIARSWKGTPYHHQAAVRGIGADCLGLLRGVWREVYGGEAETPPPYTRDWAEARADEDLIDAAARHLSPVPVAAARPGDVLLFRMRKGAPAKHVGLLATPDTFIHAMEGVPVAEVALQAWWRRRIAVAFSFPGATD
ncbi:MAG: C40 family peptidase [Alphaproteobacteria bacterium]|nr:C40 family peptidase [Alphaproteobacteria bacterium]